MEKMNSDQTFPTWIKFRSINNMTKMFVQMIKYHEIFSLCDNTQNLYQTYIF
uniref:Uncharacterized protein n=1 Tax=Anguilla anguilla TaxID=7936 RepID=A0A0E9WBT5_ANGAN